MALTVSHLVHIDHVGPESVSNDDPNLFTVSEFLTLAVPSTVASAATSSVVSAAASGALDSIPVSTADSKGVSAGARASVADSKTVSQSVNTSVADSKAVSVSGNTSIADSKATSIATAVIIPSVGTLPGFLQAGTGAVLRTANSKMAEVVSIADFGASAAGAAATNRAAIQAALNTGADVFIPAGTYNIDTVCELTVVGQRVFGVGPLSKIVQQGINENANCFRALNLGKNEFHNLWAVPGTTVNSGSYGYGFMIYGSDECVVQNCRASGYRHGGIVIWDSNYCKVRGCHCHDSVVVDGDALSQAGADIAIYGDSSHNLIQGNHCINGAGYGIAVQTQAAAQTADHNVIDSNVIQNAPYYGIMLYLLYSSTVNYNSVTNNKIDTVTGNIHEDGGLYNGGCGIYIQTADYTLISGNHIRNTSVHTPQDLNQVPAAIGVSGCPNAVIVGNFIEDANYFGIAAIQATSYTPSGRGLIIANNHVRTTIFTPIYVLDVPVARISGNQVYGSGVPGFGILVRQASLTQSADFEITNNRIENCSQGIANLGTIDRCLISGNTIRSNTSYAMYLTAALALVTNNMIVQSPGGGGILITATCLEGRVTGNYITGGTDGIVDLLAGELLIEQNQIISVTNPYNGGAANSFARVLENAAQPRVKNGRWFYKNDTTTVTDLLSGGEGQVVTIEANASFVMVSGATLMLAGGVNFSMTANDVITLVRRNSVWREMSRSVN